MCLHSSIIIGVIIRMGLTGTVSSYTVGVGGVGWEGMIKTWTFRPRTSLVGVHPFSHLRPVWTEVTERSDEEGPVRGVWDTKSSVPAGTGWWVDLPKPTTDRDCEVNHVITTTTPRLPSSIFTSPVQSSEPDLGPRSTEGPLETRWKNSG